MALKDIAEAVGRGLKLPVVSLSPEDAAKHFGPRMFFASIANPASNALTREQLGWAPGAHPGLIEDLDHSTAYAAGAGSAGRAACRAGRLAHVGLEADRVDDAGRRRYCLYVSCNPRMTTSRSMACPASRKA